MQIRRYLDEAHLFSRLFEWVMTGALIGLGVWVLIWPTSIGASAFRFVLFGYATSFIPWVFILQGVFSAGALGANGRWGYNGCMIRAWAALMRAVLWGEMAMALVLLFVNTGSIPSPGIPVYTLLACGELLSCYVAASDGSYYKGVSGGLSAASSNGSDSSNLGGSLADEAREKLPGDRAGV